MNEASVVATVAARIQADRPAWAEPAEHAIDCSDLVCEGGRAYVFWISTGQDVRVAETRHYDPRNGNRTYASGPYIEIDDFEGHECTVQDAETIAADLNRAIRLLKQIKEPTDVTSGSVGTCAVFPWCEDDHHEPRPVEELNDHHGYVIIGEYEDGRPRTISVMFHPERGVELYPELGSEWEIKATEIDAEIDAEIEILNRMRDIAHAIEKTVER